MWLYEERTFLEDGAACEEALRQGCTWCAEGQQELGERREGKRREEKGKGETRVAGVRTNRGHCKGFDFYSK